MSVASVELAAYIPEQLTHINTDGVFIKVWGIPRKKDLDYVRDIIEIYTPKLVEGFFQIRSLTELILGKIVLAFYNNLFQRAKIVQVDVGSTRKVIVHFIDLGVVTSVDSSDIRIGDTILGWVSQVPQTGLAEEFILHGVVAKKQWTSREVESVNLCLRHHTELTLTGIVGDKKIIQVMMAMNAQERINLSNFLIEDGLANQISDNNLSNMLNSKYNKIPVPVANPFTVPPSSTPDVPVPSSFAIPKQSQIRGTSVSPVYPTDTSQTSLPPTYQRIRVSKPQSLFPVTAILSYVYPTLPVDSTHDVVVSHVIDGMNTFTVQLKKSADVDLPRLMARINDIRPVPITEHIAPGDLCLGRFQDKSLCRAVVSNVLTDCASIYFVDFGNTEIVSFNEIYKIPPEFFQEPTMALRFALADLPSTLSTAEASAIFANIVLQEDLDFKLKVVKPLVPTQQRCELFIIANGKAINIKTEILNKVKLMKPAEFQKITFKKGQRVDVVVTFSESPLRFFVQLELNQSILEVLMEFIKDYCTNSKNKDILFKEDIVENMAVCAPFEDDKYYRGLILDEPDNEGNITVFYVDYGNQDTVHYSKLRIVNNEMSQFPIQAIECRLDIDSSLITNTEVTDMFIELVDSENFVMSVKNILPGDILLVDLVDQHGLNVASHLTETFGAKSTSAGYSVSPKMPLQQSSSSDWKVKKSSSVEDNLLFLSLLDNLDGKSRSDSNFNHLQSSFDDRGKDSHFKPIGNDSDSVDNTDDASSEKSSDSGSKADNGESRRHDKFNNDRSNDRYGGFRGRSDTRNSYNNDNDTWNSRNSQGDNRVGVGGRRFNDSSRDKKNKTSGDDFDGWLSGDDRFDARSLRRDKRSNDAGFNDRPQKGNHFYDVEEKRNSRSSRRRVRSAQAKGRQNVDPPDCKGIIRRMAPVPL